MNLAITTTRTQDPGLMNDAYDLLEWNPPQECAAFYEEGLSQAEKPVYGPFCGTLHKMDAQTLKRHNSRP